MADFLSDTFDEASNTAMASHTANTGGTWAASATFGGGNVRVVGGAGWVDDNTSNSLGIFYNPATPPTADYEVEAVIRSVGSPLDEVGVLARCGSSGIGWYWARWIGGNWELLAGVTSLGTYAQAIAANTDYTLKLTVVGDAISVYVDGVLRIGPITNTVTTAARNVGFTLASATFVIKSIRAGEIASGPALTAGTASVTTTGTTTATVTATDATGGSGSYTYQWYRDTSPGFTPSGANDVVGATSRTLNDTGLTRGATYYYKLVYDDGAATVTSNEISLTTKTHRLVADGNSQTAGAVGTSWASLISDILEPVWAIANVSVSGQTTAAMVTDYSSQIAPYYEAGNTENVLVAQEVMNHIYFGATAQQAYDSLREYCAAGQASGFSVVVIGPQPERGDFPGTSTLPGANAAAQEAEYTSRVNAFYDLFLADWWEFCDAFFDLRIDRNLSDRTTSFYDQSDDVHWTTAGETRVAIAVAALIPMATNPNTASGGTTTNVIVNKITNYYGSE